jgi:integrase/recombinase XerD
MKTKLEVYKTYCLNIKKSLVNYNYLRPLCKYLEEKKLEFSTLTKDNLAQYFTDKNYKPKSINAVITGCRDFCKYEGIIEHASFQIKLLEVETRDRPYITYEELLQGVKYYATYSKRGMSSNKCNAILKFMFFTGVRKGELLSLKREKIDLTNCSVSIWGQKDKTERTVYFPDKIIKDLTDYFNSELEGDNAFNISITELDYLMKKIGKYLNKSISPHTLRHSTGTYMVDKNISPLVMQRIFGHASLQTTLIYARTDDKMAQKNYREQIG